MKTRHKAFAYITNGNRILVFDHADFPKAGTQVPAGTIKENEDPIDAVLREAVEETGLSDFSLPYFLGETNFEVKERDEIHIRHFYHLSHEGPVEETWEHLEMEPSDGSSEPIRFKLFWLDLKSPLPEVSPGHDAFIFLLRKRMRIKLKVPIEKPSLDPIN